MSWSTARRPQGGPVLAVTAAAMAAALTGLAVAQLPTKVTLVPVAAIVAWPLLSRQWAAGLCIAPAFLIPVSTLLDPPSVAGFSARFLLAFLSLGLAGLYWARAADRPRLALWPFAALLGTSLFVVVAGKQTGFGTKIELVIPMISLAGLILGQSIRSSEALRSIALVTTPLAILAVAEAAGVTNPFFGLLNASTYADLASTTGAARAVSSFGHPLIAGACFTAVGCLALSIRSRFATAMALVLFAGAIATVSRSAILALVAAVVVLFIQRRGAGRLRVVAVVTAGTLAITGIVSAIPTLRESFNNRVGNVTSKQSGGQQDVRRNTLKIFDEDIRARPASLLVGHGFGYSTQMLDSRGGNANGYDIFDNEYVTAVYDIGLLPACFFLILMAIGVYRGAPSGRSRAAPTLTAVAVVMLFADGLAWQSLTFILFIAVGIATQSEADSPMRSSWLAPGTTDP